MNLSYKNRIAFHYMIATAMAMALVFFSIFLVVQTAVYTKLDEDLAYEAHKHTTEIRVVKDSILFINKLEWEEREHREAQVNPVFVQIVDQKGRLMDKSPNLKEEALAFHFDKKLDTHFDTELNNEAIRQVQIPIQEYGILKGYILTAISQEGAKVVLSQLKNTLLLLFPIVLFGLFIITRFLAGRSILPVKVINVTADRITRNNLDERIPLPQNKDELYTLASSINNLLDRIQSAMDREKQFTADASHQLRTPLSVLKGTLEVLVRKPRKEEEYREKIKLSIHEIDRISGIVNQLLILARFNNSDQKLTLLELSLPTLIDDILLRLKSEIEAKFLSIQVKAEGNYVVRSAPYYLDLIVENILSNAIKYSLKDALVKVSLYENADHRVVCQIRDYGIGIQAEDIEKIYIPFFRSEEIHHQEIKGNGLGLSIVKKASELLNIQIKVSSQLGQGSAFELIFPDRVEK